MKITLLSFLRLLCLLMVAGFAHAQGNLEINTPVVAQLKGAMQARHTQLMPMLYRWRNVRRRRV